MTFFMQALTESLPGWEIEPVGEGNLTEGLEILASNWEGCYEANTPGLSFWRFNGFKVLRSCIRPDEPGASQGNSRCLLVLEKNL